MQTRRASVNASVPSQAPSKPAASPADKENVFVGRRSVSEMIDDDAMTKRRSFSRRVSFATTADVRLYVKDTDWMSPEGPVNPNKGVDLSATPMYVEEMPDKPLTLEDAIRLTPSKELKRSNLTPAGMELSDDSTASSDAFDAEDDEDDDDEEISIKPSALAQLVEQDEFDSPVMVNSFRASLSGEKAAKSNPDADTPPKPSLAALLDEAAGDNTSQDDSLVMISPPTAQTTVVPDAGSTLKPLNLSATIDQAANPVPEQLEAAASAPAPVEEAPAANSYSNRRRSVARREEVKKVLEDDMGAEMTVTADYNKIMADYLTGNAFNPAGKAQPWRNSIGAAATTTATTTAAAAAIATPSGSFAQSKTAPTPLSTMFGARATPGSVTRSAAKKSATPLVPYIEPALQQPAPEKTTRIVAGMELTGNYGSITAANTVAAAVAAPAQQPADDEMEMTASYGKSVIAVNTPAADASAASAPEKTMRFGQGMELTGSYGGITFASQQQQKHDISVEEEAMAMETTRAYGAIHVGKQPKPSFAAAAMQMDVESESQVSMEPTISYGKIFAGGARPEATVRIEAAMEMTGSYGAIASSGPVAVAPVVYTEDVAETTERMEMTNAYGKILANAARTPVASHNVDNDLMEITRSVSKTALPFPEVVDYSARKPVAAVSRTATTPVAPAMGSATPSAQYSVSRMPPGSITKLSLSVSKTQPGNQSVLSDDSSSVDLATTGFGFSKILGQFNAVSTSIKKDGGAPTPTASKSFTFTNLVNDVNVRRLSDLTTALRRRSSVGKRVSIDNSANISMGLNSSMGDDTDGENSGFVVDPARMSFGGVLSRFMTVAPTTPARADNSEFDESLVESTGSKRRRSLRTGSTTPQQQIASQHAETGSGRAKRTRKSIGDAVTAAAAPVAVAPVVVAAPAAPAASTQLALPVPAHANVITFDEFSTIVNMRFLDDFRRGTMVLPGVLARSQNVLDHELSLKEKLEEACVFIPQMEIFEWGCDQLSQITSKVQGSITSAISEVNVANPAVFAVAQQQTNVSQLQAMAKKLKYVCRLGARKQWYEWRAKLETQAQNQLRDDLMRLREDLGRIQTGIDLFGELEKFIKVCEQRKGAVAESQGRLVELNQSFAEQNLVLANYAQKHSGLVKRHDELVGALASATVEQRTLDRENAQLTEAVQALLQERGDGADGLASFNRQKELKKQVEEQFEQLKQVSHGIAGITLQSGANGVWRMKVGSAVELGFRANLLTKQVSFDSFTVTAATAFAGLWTAVEQYAGAVIVNQTFALSETARVLAELTGKISKIEILASDLAQLQRQFPSARITVSTAGVGAASVHVSVSYTRVAGHAPLSEVKLGVTVDPWVYPFGRPELSYAIVSSAGEVVCNEQLRMGRQNFPVGWGFLEQTFEKVVAL